MNRGTELWLGSFIVAWVVLILAGVLVYVSNGLILVLLAGFLGPPYIAYKIATYFYKRKS